jgi:hypothetical protein
MKIERFAGHNEAREALMISVASVTAIMLTAYLILLILYWPLAQTAKDEWPGRQRPGRLLVTYVDSNLPLKSQVIICGGGGRLLMPSRR